jgi:hypothetical protein
MPECGFERQKAFDRTNLTDRIHRLPCVIGSLKRALLATLFRSTLPFGVK